ncbi:carboxypeptidase-like regulatory domain-containing protein [Marinobacter sp. CA1]|uniref:carboxypeptidase-like regulatory domain-containing protein n=1 Tax=Marinobacter sp. CA1 TaxID=2817656 RepID=UPI001D06CF2F|nr:carboxypeptidase-like regulatory domain-containing protein [Marinobacter sp. CA1]UDL04768.1 carboxypeptidase regulatory-like domain-containing protein [Marinobacter sp. CA1]
MIKRIWIPLVIVLAAATATGVYAGMFSFLKKYDVLLFPSVEGRLTNQGEPLAGVEIIREATYDEVEAETVETDTEGRFSFPEWTTRSNTPGKPLIEARLRQVVAAKYEGEYYILWQYTTDRIDEEPVISDLLKNLDCDIANEEIDHYFPIPDNPQFDHIIGSICRWKTSS